MKKVYLLYLVLLVSLSTYAQNVTPVDSVKPGHGPRNEQLKEIKEEKIKKLSDSTGGNEPRKNPHIDTTVTNRYGDLLDDDSLYNKKYPWWKPALGVLGTNVFI